MQNSSQSVTIRPEGDINDNISVGIAAPNFLTTKVASTRLLIIVVVMRLVCRAADTFLAFPIFLFAPQPKEFFLDALKKLEQRSHKCVELRGEYAE
jgi:hypothetical protein